MNVAHLKKKLTLVNSPLRHKKLVNESFVKSLQNRVAVLIKIRFLNIKKYKTSDTYIDLQASLARFYSFHFNKHV